MERVNQELAPRQPDGQALVRSAMAIFNENPDAFESGPHVARLVVDLLSAEVRDASIAEIVERWRAETGPVPGALAC